MTPGSIIRRKRNHAVVAAAAVAVLALGFAVQHAGTALIVSQPLHDPDIIISLASHEWERLPLAASLAARYPRAQVLLTLPANPTLSQCHDCPNRAARLVRAGVGLDRIRVVPLSLPGTYGEAIASLSYVRQGNMHRVLVVTSPYHTRRSLSLFRTVFANAGVEIGVLPATAYSPARPERWWMDPYDRWYVSYEWAARVYYAVRYGVPM
jgi:uncharacterized SAM-binding protein YcdF (DUF218 family)